MTFFGTPHRGMVVDDILRMLGENSPRQELVESIAAGSAELGGELERFVNYCTKIKLFTFKETERTRKLQQVRVYCESHLRFSSYEALF